MAVRVIADLDDGGHGQEPPPQTRARIDGWAVDEVASWLRFLVWSLGPVAPGIAIAGGNIVVSCSPGSVARAAVPIVNRQATAVSLLLEPSVLRAADGTEWLPDVIRRAAVTVPGRERRTTTLEISVPAELPVGVYRGALVALGMEGVDPALTLEVTP